MKLFKHRLKGFLISLRVGMSSVFISIFLIITLTLVYLTSLSFNKSISYLAYDLLASNSIHLSRALSTLLSPATPISTLSSLAIEDKTVDPNNFTEIIQYTIDLLKLLPQAAMIHWGDEQGNFVISKRQPDNSMITQYFNNHRPQDGTVYINRNKYGQIIQTKTNTHLKYDPRKRPWYQAGKKAGNTVWSNIYTFQTEDEKGISSATPSYLNGKLLGVFSIEYNVDSLFKFLDEHRVSLNSLSFVVNDQGNLIIYPNYLSGNQLNFNFNFIRPTNIDEFSNSPMYVAFNDFKKHQKSKFSFSYDNQTYLASFSVIPEFANYHWYVGIVVPKNDFVGPLQHFNMVILELLLIILIIGLQLISFFSKKISVPFNKLAHQLEEIKFFKIQPKPKIKTFIKEVFTMSKAIESMKIGLASFKKYVPENLVQQLFFTGEAAKIGGESRDIAVFFSDIINFTTLAERLDSDKMMQYLCEYFDEITHIIARNKGTVDKYIGDSVMAFWGAPLLDKNSIRRACKTALECQKRLEYLKSKNKRCAFPTRFGIHFDTAIVGNLGSSQRMNYTAIGNAVNTANRLEQMNKFYGTRIIVSEQVKVEVSDQFIFRILDRIVIKGKKKSIFIYELIKSKTDDVAHTNEKIIQFCELYHLGFTAYQHQDWKTAINYFEQTQRLKPDDFATHLMINRCHIFEDNPPLKNWDGTWIYAKKY